MYKSVAIATAAAAMMIAAGAPAQAQMSGFKSLSPTTATESNQLIHKTGRKGRRIAGAIALGLIGAAAIAGHAHSYHYDRYDRYSRHERRCRRWRRWCRNGSGNACWKFDNRC